MAECNLRILISGDREWWQWSWIRECLSWFDPKTTILIHGAAWGADSIAAEIAAETFPKENILSFPANWTEHSRRAGPIRNRQMLREGKPDLVIAFHHNLCESKGTKDMVLASREAKVPVLHYG